MNKNLLDFPVEKNKFDHVDLLLLDNKCKEVKKKSRNKKLKRKRKEQKMKIWILFQKKEDPKWQYNKFKNLILEDNIFTN